MTNKTMSQNGLLIVAPHALDEILGCGGVAAMAAAAGRRVDVLVAFGDGQGHDAKRRESAQAAADILGYGTPQYLGFTENRGDTLALGELVGPIENLLRDCAPHDVYVPFGNSLHGDHKKTYQAAITAARPLPGSPVRALLAYEIISSTDWAIASDGAFTPDSFVEITPALAAKLDAVAAYDFEMRDEPHARSPQAVERLARMRGSTVGFGAAEAFMTLRRRAPVGVE
ncbi:MAG: PIG-L family deacetylase [Rhodospirillaceae bacterium]|nr:PIG-L family deacetylase [Rhodospirillaceae bacterium]